MASQARRRGFDPRRPLEIHAGFAQVSAAVRVLPLQMSKKYEIHSGRRIVSIQYSVSALQLLSTTCARSAVAKTRSGGSESTRSPGGALGSAPCSFLWNSSRPNRSRHPSRSRASSVRPRSVETPWKEPPDSRGLAVLPRSAGSSEARRLSRAKGYLWAHDAFVDLKRGHRNPPFPAGLGSG